ncbi:MAG: DEAD/DEAH box helicase [Microbacterium sp.]
MTSSSQALRQARPHPFAAPAEDLVRLVGGTPDALVARLPSLRRSPLDSPELYRITRRPEGRSAPSLLPWTVPVVEIAPSVLGDVLGRLIDPTSDESSGRDVRAAASVRHLMRLARFAEELVERRRVLPAIDADEPLARWRAVLRGPDAVAAHALIAAMPPALRAAGSGEHRPGDIAEGILDAVADARMRSLLPASLLPARRGRKPARVPVGEAWLDALVGPDPRIDADLDEISDLRSQLAPWAGTVREEPGPARLVLRLSDPGTARGGAPDGEDAAREVSAGAIDAAIDAADDLGAELLVEIPAEAGSGLHPGAGHTDGWRLEFLLRSSADPSLLVDAGQVWTGDGSLDRWLARPREVLLAELARAQRIYPGLEAGLRQAQPTALDLDADGAHAFLSVHAAALAEAGVEVLLPSWWSRRARLGLKLSVTPTEEAVQDSGFSRELLCDFRWELAVGDHGLTHDEIAALAAAKAPLVRLRGEWVAIDQRQLQRGLEFLRREGAGQKTVGEILVLTLSHPDDLELPLELTGVTADGWLGDLLNGDAAMEAVAPPDDFAATLRPYQQRGLSWLDFLGRLGLGAVLADDMGLGKTVQLLALEATARARATDGADAAPDAAAATDAGGAMPPASRPTLLLCPMSLIGNWQAEAARFAPRLRVLAHHGAGRPRGDDLAAALAGADLVVTTYATALNDIEELAGIEWERIVLDEAQAIKNRLSRTARAVRRLRAGQRIALTGTPVENRLADLWSLMDAVNPGMLGAPELFGTRFATPIERHHDDEAAALLRRITRPYILRRLKTDPAIIDDLPEKIEITQHYRLTVEQASLYQSVVDDMMMRIDASDGIERRGNILAAMTKLKQICNHPAQLLHDGSLIGRRSGKIIRFEEILEEILAEGDRVLCFTQFTEFAEMLVPHLAARFDTDIAYLSGSTARQRRTELVERFQSGDGPPVFVLSLKAGGTGLNLTAANHVVHLDRWWNPAVENQATDRAFRIGQKRRVQVRKFVGTGTLEERIDQLIEEKKALANLAVGDGESWLTELSTSELRELFALSKDAVGGEAVSD